MLVLGAPCLTVLVAAVFTQWIARPPSLGNEYALCSPDGANIYTVDDALPNVQCIGVNGSYIFDRGHLGEYLAYSSSMEAEADIYLTKPTSEAGGVRPVKGKSSMFE
jgi:hypothetical protein